MKPIDTFYNGHSFRSRLEARWSIFYDTVGISYEYEKEGYDLHGMLYLPDFWLPQQNCFVEIKGQTPTVEETNKCALLAGLTEKMVYLFYPSIPVKVDQWDTDSAEAFFPDDGWDNQYAWCLCQDCGGAGVQFNGRSDRLPCKMCFACAQKVTYEGIELTEDDCCLGKCPRHGGNLDKGYSYDAIPLIMAYDMARQARFEFWQAR